MATTERPLTPWPFERGRAYNRRSDIHSRYGGQQQGGIITPRSAPVVIAITGEEGQQHGYADQLRSDGVFEYFGEGQIGDMPMVRGNLAISTHAAAGKSILLFRKLRDASLRYDGEWVCQGYQVRVAPDRENRPRSAFVFELRPLDAIVAEVEGEQEGDRTPIALPELRRRALEAAAESSSANIASRNIFKRSRHVRDYVLARAGGLCEGCNSPAPFNRPDGTPYLEPHHIRRVSDGGPDDPRHVIALCPTCHRRVHAGADGAIYNTTMAERMRTLDPL